MLLPLEVAYDEFTEDIEENRLLKTALHRLSRLPVRSSEARREINGLRPVFNTVALAAYIHGAPEVRYTRLNSHYRPAVELARLIIDNSSLGPVDIQAVLAVLLHFAWQLWPMPNPKPGPLPSMRGKAVGHLDILPRPTQQPPSRAASGATRSNHLWSSIQGRHSRRPWPAVALC